MKVNPIISFDYNLKKKLTREVDFHEKKFLFIKRPEKNSRNGCPRILCKKATLTNVY